MTMHSTKRNSSDTIANRAATIAKDFHDVGDAAKRVASDSIVAVRDTAQQYLDRGRSRTRQLGDDVQSRIQEQPLKALLLAAGIGFLLGACWVRR